MRYTACDDPMTTWNDVIPRKGILGDREALTDDTVKLGAWVCNSLTGTWFKILVHMPPQVAGVSIKGVDIIASTVDCYLPWKG